MIRFARPLVLVGLFLTAASPAAAAVGYATTSPLAATPGQTVTVVVDPFNCPILWDGAHPPTLQMALIPLERGDGRYPAILTAAAAPASYTFVVPDAPPGAYSFDLGCYASGGSIGTIPNPNHDPPGFRVLSTVPATATSIMPGPDLDPVIVLVLFVVGLVAAYGHFASARGDH